MKRKIFNLLILFSLSSLLAVAQQKKATISFDSEKHNFGTIQENAGPVTHVFEFTNTGSEPLILSRVKASCGCTATDWSKEPVAPGKTGQVKATYNPLRRPGNFNKTITVTSNAQRQRVVLRISGNVKPKVKTLAEKFPKKIGDLRMRTNHIPFNNTKSTQIKNNEMVVVNAGKTDLSIAFRNIPGNIKIEAIPATLKPEQQGVIKVTYDANKKRDLGFVMDRVDLILNGVNMGQRDRILVSATLKEDFSSLTEEDLKNAPVIEYIGDVVYEFGDINQGDVRSHEFEFKNSGKSDLIIRKTRSTCGCTVAQLAKKTLAPGETGVFKITFNSRGKKGTQNRAITVYTNDPKHSETKITMHGNVLFDKK